jgi:hypothetical protein
MSEVFKTLKGFEGIREDSFFWVQCTKNWRTFIEIILGAGKPGCFASQPENTKIKYIKYL